MAAPTLQPCSPWSTTADLCSPCNDYTLDSALLDDFLDVASRILYLASGQKYNGLCSETIRPCTLRTASAHWPFPNPVNISGRWYDGPGGFPSVAVCGCRVPDSCGCGTLQAIELPRFPITDVTEVLVDGTALADSDYRVDAYRYLVRLDGDGWPCCQDLSLASTEDDTFSVSYTWGREPPITGVKAAAVLACELYRLCEPEAFEGECRLPRNIASLSRQGVTIDFQAVESLFSPRNGKPIYFGIPEIDLFLATENPNGLVSPSVILSPDDPDLGRLVGT